MEVKRFAPKEVNMVKFIIFNAITTHVAAFVLGYWFGGTIWGWVKRLFGRSIA